MSILDEALKYVAFGFRVFPVHGIDNQGLCTCGSPACQAAAKHPRTYQGVKDATSDPEVVKRWWSMWPNANVALACGPGSGVFVVDIDPRHDGHNSIEEFELNREEGPLPPTLVAASGGGGRHLFFRWPEGGVPGRNPWLPGVEVKAEGGYVVLPPSRHISGGTYSWVSKYEPATAPDDLLLSIRGGGMYKPRAALPPAKDILKGIPEGQRDDVLFRHACQLRRKGLEIDQALVLILEAARNCTPPFPEDQARRKVEQAWKYQSEEDDLPIGASITAEDGTEGRHLTDDGNAHRLVDRYGNDLRYVTQWGWLVWDGCRWLRDETSIIIDKARDTVQSIYEEAANETEDKVKRKALSTWAFKSESAGRIEAMIKLARSDRKVAMDVHSFDADPWLFNCTNGVLDLRTGELREHLREDLISRVAGTRHDPHATCPAWLAFLERIIPDPDVREFIRRAVGYSLTGVTREKVMFILHGSGNNGKTLFLEAVRAILGDYAMSTPSASLTNRKADAIPNDIARLKGARFVTASETEQGSHMASSFVKEITGGDKINARFMRQEWFEFTPEFKLWLATNHTPIISDFGDAMWQRLRLIPFDVQIPKTEQVPRDVMLERFANEAAGILSWATNGCLAWQEYGLTEPAGVMLATETYRDDMDWFGEFLHDCCGKADVVTSNDQLYDAFKRWSLLRGDLKPWTIASFTRQLKSRGYKPARTREGRKGFHGIVLRDGVVVPSV